MTFSRAGLELRGHLDDQRHLDGLTGGGESLRLFRFAGLLAVDQEGELVGAEVVDDVAFKLDRGGVKAQLSRGQRRRVKALKAAARPAGLGRGGQAQQPHEKPRGKKY